jgi:flagellar motor switch protein FliG
VANSSAIKLKKADDIQYQNLRGFEKAAILVNYLGPDASKKILAKMDDADIRKLLTFMQKLRIVPIEVTKQVLEEFYDLISESRDYIFSDRSSSKETIIDALGEERARGILGHLNAATSSTRSLESLELVDAKSLANFLLNEHPQTVAVILAHLEAEKKGEVLKRLPEPLQAEVVLRMANLDHVAPELITEVDRVLKDELANIGTVEQSQLGGIQTVAEMLNVMDKGAEKAIMSRVEEKDPLLAEEIRKLMFIFDDIIKIDDRGIQTLLKEVANDKLLLAMKTASEEIKEKIFKNLSKRAADLLRDDVSTMGPVRVADVEAAQMEIVNIARRLEAEGKILIARGGAEDALV